MFTTQLNRLRININIVYTHRISTGSMIYVCCTIFHKNCNKYGNLFESYKEQTHFREGGQRQYAH